MKTWSKRTRLVVLSCSLFFIAPHTVSAADNTVDLQWSPNSEDDLAGYKVFHGTQSGVYGFPVFVGKSTTHHMDNLSPDTTHYFAITAYDETGNESDPSQEVSKTIPVSLPPAVTSPAPNSILEGTSATFTWQANETNVTEWWLNVGSTEGTWDLFDTGSLGTSTSATISGFPTDGSKFWVRLWYKIASGWKGVDYTYTAGTEPENFTLRVQKNGNGSGKFISNPVGQSCSNTCPGHTKKYPSGTNISFTAKSASDSVFVGWNGGGCSGTGICTVNVDKAKTVTATFNVANFTSFPLSVKKSGSGKGKFISNPLGQSCSATCLGHTQTYPSGTSISFTADPASDSVFTGWSGGGCNGTGTCTVSVDQATTVTANFTLSQTSTSGPSIVNPIPGGVLPGDTATFTWESQGTSVNEWWLYVGTTMDAKDILSSGSISSNTFSKTVSNLPTNGNSVWVKLWWKISGSWQSKNFQFSAASIIQ